jgi:OOP family OmpA-OmpF porin
MKKHLLIALLAIAGLSPMLAQAQSAYLGASVGRAEQKASVHGFGSISDSDTGAKLFGGYQVNPMFGIEAGYAVLGEMPQRAGNIIISAEPTSLYLAATATFPLAPQFHLTGKLGYARNTTKLRLSGYANDKEDDNSMVVGIGASYALQNNLALVLEYENFGKVIKNNGIKLKADLLSVGLRLNF